MTAKKNAVAIKSKIKLFLFAFIWFARDSLCHPESLCCYNVPHTLTCCPALHCFSAVTMNSGGEWNVWAGVVVCPPEKCASTKGKKVRQAISISFYMQTQLCQTIFFHFDAIAGVVVVSIREYFVEIRKLLNFHWKNRISFRECSCSRATTTRV